MLQLSMQLSQQQQVLQQLAGQGQPMHASAEPAAALLLLD
jgi:hypothetical protein